MIPPRVVAGLARALPAALCWVLAQAPPPASAQTPVPTVPDVPGTVPTTTPQAPTTTTGGAPGADPVGLNPVGADPIGGDPVGGDPIGGDPVSGDELGPPGTAQPPTAPATQTGVSPSAPGPSTASPVGANPVGPRGVTVPRTGPLLPAGTPPVAARVGPGLTDGQLADGPVLPFAEAEAWTLRDHPLAIAARAVEQRGAAELLAARGAYDPALQGDFERKQYIKSLYFEYTDVGLEWQSPYAFKLEGGRQWAEGININPERTLPDAGQAYLAVKLPVLQGLLTDKYRIGVKRGRVSEDLNRAAADIIRNELRYDLAVRYAEWAYAHVVEEITRETEALIVERLENTRELYLLGDKPAVDTLEALVALVNQQLATQTAAVSVQIARQNLRAIYFALPPDARPDYAALAPGFPLDTAAVATHPQLRELRADFAALQLQRRLYREYLKPRLDLSYSVLGDGFDLTPADGSETMPQLLTSAYKVGATFRYPILNRQARGQLQAVDIKRAETGAKLEAKRQELTIKAEANLRAAAVLREQLVQLDGFVEQTAQLLQAERDLFSLGESTQFLLNSREQSYQKAVTTRAKAQLSYAKAIYAYRQATASWP